MDILQQASKSVKETNKQVVSQGLHMLNAAFAFVAALAWNEAVKAFIERYFKAGNGLLSQDLLQNNILANFHKFRLQKLHQNSP